MWQVYVWWPFLKVIAGMGLGVAGMVYISFVVWKNLRTEYPEEEIISLCVWLLICALAGAVVSKAIIYQVWGFSGAGAALGLGWGLWYWCRKNNWDIWEWLDVLAPAALGVAFIGSLLIGPVMRLFVLGWGVGILATKAVRKYYRNFKWYKSGKLGFVGLFVVWWWAMWEIVVAMTGGTGLYWRIGFVPEQFVAGWVLAFCIVSIYIRSGRKFSQDLKGIVGKK